MQNAIDHTLPEGRWAFNAEVTTVFENMLSRSIPQYEVMRRACFEVACRYVQPDTTILDLGCSRGEAIASLLDRYKEQNHFVGVEVSEPMLEAARERFREDIERGRVEILSMDLRREYPEVEASVTLSVLTLQFTPIEYRQRIVAEVYRHTREGGVFLLVEKILGASAEIDEVLVETYYGLKREQGYSEEEIERKRLSLEGVLVPVTARWNEELLRDAGFRQVDCFWRWMNFAGWVALK
jgi:tRNA (cmo5U34)-methyltransferase